MRAFRISVFEEKSYKKEIYRENVCVYIWWLILRKKPLDLFLCSFDTFLKSNTCVYLYDTEDNKILSKELINFVIFANLFFNCLFALPMNFGLSINLICLSILLTRAIDWISFNRIFFSSMSKIFIASFDVI